MEFDEDACMPPTRFDLLLQQVDEQSELCDVTIMAGTLVKKFHWCILVASPFFEAIYRNRNFLEQSTGIIKLRVQHPYKMVEDAIFFMYGKRPKISLNNVGGLLEMAEFLLLPALKAHCVELLEKVDISCENCFQILHLVSIFNIALPYCEIYISGNLLELLDKDEALTMDKETIMELLKDSELTYVPLKQWFNFLVKWTRSDPRREKHFAELFSLLDVTDVDEELRQLMINETFVVRLGISVLDSIQSSLSETAKVIIFPNDNRDCIHYFLRIDNGRWYRFCGDLHGIIGVEDITSPVVYQYAGDPRLSHAILIKDLTKNPCQNANNVTELIDRDTGEGLHDIKNMAFIKSTCYTVVRQRVEIVQSGDTKMEPVPMTSGHIHHHASLPLKVKLNRFRYPNRVETNAKHVYKLYKGDLQEKQTFMDPLISLRGDKTITQFAVDMTHNIAMFFEMKDELIIYNDSDGFVERIRFREFPNYQNAGATRLTARECGFVLIDSSQICCVSAVQCPVMQKRFQVTIFTLPPINVYFDKYIICRDLCFRFQSFSDDNAISYTNLDNFKNSMTDVDWVNVDITNIDHTFRDEFGTIAYMISLPKGMLRCSRDCPHCILEHTVRNKRSSCSNDYTDSDNEDLMNYGGSSSDDSDSYIYYFSSE